MKKFIMLFLALNSFQISLGQITNTEVVAELKVETTNNISTLTAKAFNRTDVYLSLRYVVSVTIFDANYKSLNKTLEDFLNSPDAKDKTLEDFLNSLDASKYSSKESFEDFFSLDPYQSKDLYRTYVETGISNKIIVLLLVYNEANEIVARNRVVFNESNKEEVTNKEEAVPKDGIELTGLVTEETLTKNGKDFYDQFYYYYYNNSINGDEVVVIEEMFTFRTRTKISVKIGDEEIFSFFGSSNDEYIDEMAKISVQKVYKYFENKKKEKTYITQY